MVLTAAIAGLGMTAVAPPARATAYSVQYEIANLAISQNLKVCSQYSWCSGEWCSEWASWVWKNADPGIVVTGLTPKAASFDTYGANNKTTSKYPAVGDAVTFGSPTYHVAIVVAYTSSTVTIVAGNTELLDKQGNVIGGYEVREGTLKLTDSSIHQYIAPVVVGRCMPGQPC
jgi:hypothetical protein